MSVVIVDTQCANLTSVRFALERLGVTPIISADATVIRAAKRVILPGVGTAAAAMRALQASDLVSTLQQLTQPVLGICLGMQLLTEYSREGKVNCLGVIPTRTAPLTSAGLPLPHMGWNTLNATQPHALLQHLPTSAYCYFVHSYAVPVSAVTLATTDYGERFSAMIGYRNFFGAQFHPERSGAVGAQILKNFLELDDVNSGT